MCPEELNIASRNDLFNITPYNNLIDFSTAKGYTRLDLKKNQAAQLSAILQHVPELEAASEMAQTYKVVFPEGVAGTLMEYTNGTFGTPLIGESGKISDHAGLISLAPQSIVFAAFSVMAIASGQYFLKRINNELKLIHSKLDDILGFLYGNQKAELMAEVNFIHYAYRNYASIMEHDHQRTGVISGLIEARKVAMKDIEFYLADLERAIRVKGAKEVEEAVDKAFQIKSSLMFAMQLYGFSSVLEVYYAQNFDKYYLSYVDNDISIYIDKCEKRALSCFSTLKGTVEHTRESWFKKTDYSTVLKQIDEYVDSLSQGEKSEIQTTLKNALYSATRQAEYIISKNGEVFMKTA